MIDRHFSCFAYRIERYLYLPIYILMVPICTIPTLFFTLEPPLFRAVHW
jgi:hypothetical protein